MATHAKWKRQQIKWQWRRARGTGHRTRLVLNRRCRALPPDLGGGDGGGSAAGFGAESPSRGGGEGGGGYSGVGADPNDGDRACYVIAEPVVHATEKAADDV